MNANLKPKLWTGIGMLSIAAMFSGNKADAYEHGYYDYDRPVYVQPRVYDHPVRSEKVYQRQWIEGRYETKCETILVAPEHKEVRVIPAVLETRRDYFGKSYTVMITPEQREEICVPAKYEKVEHPVWIPGYFKDVAVDVPVCPPTPPAVYMPTSTPVGYQRGEHHHHHRNFFDVFFRD